MEVKEMATTLQLQTFLPSVGACLAGGLSEPHAIHSFIPYQPLVNWAGSAASGFGMPAMDSDVGLSGEEALAESVCTVHS